MQSVKNACLIIGLSLLTACAAEAPDPVSEPPATQYVQEGRTLAKGLAACGFCHGADRSSTAMLSGGQILYDQYGELNAPNITPSETGIKNWDTMELLQFFRTGIRPDESTISPQMHRGMEWISDDDALAIISYLKNIPAVEKEVEHRSVSILEENTTGFFDSVRSVKGYVPEIDKSYQIEFGQYLVDHVARCGSCHNTPATIFSAELYLAGGATIKTAGGEKVAPNITQSDTNGIATWSEDQIVTYLQTGNMPGGRSVDHDYCPVDFYKNALPEDLVSLAKYLKSIPVIAG